MLSAAACLPSACPGCAFCPSAASSHCPGPPPPSCPEYVFTSWHPADGALLHAIDLRSGAVKSFRAPPFFVFHWANAFHTQGGRWGGVGEWGRVGVLEEAWERLQNSSSMKEATSSCWTCVHRWLAQQGTRNRALPCAPPPPPPPPPPSRRLLHLDACLYEDPQIVNDLYLEPLRAGYAPGVQPGRAYLRRLTLDLDAPDGGRPGGREWHHAVACQPAAMLLLGGAAGAMPVLQAEPLAVGWCWLRAFNASCTGRPAAFAPSLLRQGRSCPHGRRWWRTRLPALRLSFR